MGALVDFSRESSELQKILASGIFDRSPMLAQLLKYVCTKYFEGSAGSIKEYSLAVDVLGRATDFDPKKDSIIRVQFHRLREKLNEYYVSEGANHAVQVVIPHGHYAPQFTFHPEFNGHHAGLEADVAPPRTLDSFAAMEVEEVHVRPQRAGFVSRLVARPLTWVIAGVLVLGLVLLGNRPERRKPSYPMPTLSVGDSIRILAGLAEGSFTDGLGHVWASDNFFHGGSVVTLTNHPIWGTRDPRLYQSRREGSFSYDIPAKPGDYELRLYFAETYYGDGNVAGFGGENTRSFTISINGEQVKSHFMVAGEAGINTALVKVFKDVNPARDGMIHIGFAKGNSEPFVNAIELTPGVPGKLIPIRLIAQPQGYTDRSGQVWVFDRSAVGGTVVGRSAEVTGQDDPQLYAGERFGHFSYTIPVTPGSYTVILHMAERWLGPGQPKGGIGTGSRVFDILCNGVYLERDFDVFSKAGGANRALVRTYHGIQPNHQSNIVLSFAPFHNFPILDALEVLEESR